MNLFSKISTIAAGAVVAGLVTHLTLQWWRSESEVEGTPEHIVRKYVTNHKEALITAGIAAVGLTWTVFHKKEPMFLTEGETGLFDDGTVRILARELEQLYEFGKPRILSVEHVGRFRIEALPVK